MPKSSDALRKHFRYPDPIDDKEVIDEERTRIIKRRKQARQDGLLDPLASSEKEEDPRNSVTGLALSGGGIRSGALGLGVLHALHRTGLLPFFDYLSTVSGGGYAGGYLSSAATRQKSDDDGRRDSASINRDAVSYGRLDAFHDGLGLSRRMKEFIFGGHYLNRTARFFNRYLIGLLLIWLVTLSSITTLALIASLAFRSLDEPIVRDYLSALGFRTDVSRGFFPLLLVAGVWVLLWAVSYFQNFGNCMRAQGRTAGTLLPIMATVFAVCVAALLGNGELNIDWLSDVGGFEIHGVAEQLSGVFGLGVYSLIGIGFLPYLIPGVRKSLLRSGTDPKTKKDRFIFGLTSRLVVFGVPFVFVSIFAMENVADWTKSRPVTPDVLSLYSTKPTSVNDSGQLSEATTSQIVQASSSEIDRPDYVALTKGEIRGWSPWHSAWAPFWKNLKYHESGHATNNENAAFYKMATAGEAGGEPDNGPASTVLNLVRKRIRNDGAVVVPGLPGNEDPEMLRFKSIDEALAKLAVEYKQIQMLYYCEFENSRTTRRPRPQLGFRIISRLHSLIVLVPDMLRCRTLSNDLAIFVRRRERARIIQNWLAEQVSRVLETSDLANECDWTSTLDRLSSDDQARLRTALAEARLHSVTAQAEFSKSVDNVDRITAFNNRRLLAAAFPGTLQDIASVYASNVLSFDQGLRWSLLKWSFGTWLLAVMLVNINATSLHGFYAKELGNNWLQTDTDKDIALSDVDPTSRGLPYHLISASVHWGGRRRKRSGDKQPDHFLLSPMYCGCNRTGYVRTGDYADDQIGLSDAIAISGAAISPLQHSNLLVRALLWLSNLRLGLWLPNPAHGTFLPRDLRKLCHLFPVTPLRLLMRFGQNAEDRPFLFVADGGHHENLGIGPLLKRRCRFIVAIDAGQDSDYAFSDLAGLMRWARVKHDVRLQPVDSSAPGMDRSGKDDEDLDEVAQQMKSSIDAWNELAPDKSKRLAEERTSNQHFAVLRLHYPDVDGPSWLIYAKTSLTGDEPVELIRYAELDKEFPHNPTTNQFYAADTFESYRQLGEHIIESIVGSLPQVIEGKLDEHKHEPYLVQLLKRIRTAENAIAEQISVAPPTPEALGLMKQLRSGDLSKTKLQDVETKLEVSLSRHPDFVQRLVTAVILSGKPVGHKIREFAFQKTLLDGRTRACSSRDFPKGFRLDAATRADLNALGDWLNDEVKKRHTSELKKQIRDEQKWLRELLAKFSGNRRRTTTK